MNPASFRVFVMINIIVATTVASIICGTTWNITSPVPNPGTLLTDLRIWIFDGFNFAAIFVSPHIVTVILEWLMPHLKLRACDLSVVVLMSLACPFLQMAVFWMTSNPTQPFSVAKLWLVFGSTRFGIMFVDNLIGPALPVVKSQLVSFMFRQMRFYLTRFGGTVARVFMFALFYQASLRSSVRLNARDLNAQIVKLAVTNELRLLYEGLFKDALEKFGFF